jgi:hypothetical protein
MDFHSSRHLIGKTALMKRIATFILCFLFMEAFSQEGIENIVKTEVSEVTVFIQGAQVTRKKNMDLVQGETVLKFVNLSPFIDPKSIQVKANGKVTVLSVNHQQNFLDKLERPKELNDLETRLKQVENNIRLEKTYLDIINEELAFLNANREITGNLQMINLSALKEAAAFYGESLRTLKLKAIEHNKNMEEYAKLKNDIESQIKTSTGKKEYSNGEILVKVNARDNARVTFEISYLVNNASWFPSYDIRAKSINDPIELIYKANVKQDTKEDWKNVRLRFSSSDPNRTGVAPELKTYFLGYHSMPPVYNRSTSLVSGKVTGTGGEVLPGVNILVQGTTIGAITDANGNFSITMPEASGNLVFSYIGYITETLPVTSPVMNVMLTEDVVSLQEVIVTGYSTQKASDFAGSQLQGRISGVSVKNNNNIRIRGLNSQPVPTVKLENQTTVNFEIKTPYTVLSDNKNYTLDMEVYNLPAMYQYYCVPKIDQDAFLLANIVDWEKYSLLEGEANLFFEDTYVGKSLLDVRFASDTLSISLGRDKNVSINREKSKDFTSKQFMGNKKEETRDWLITVKNNKNQKINMLLMDQVPVSTMDDIEIELQKASGAVQNAENGELSWEFSLDPGQKKDIELKYSVKYPKYQTLIIE